MTNELTLKDRISEPIDFTVSNGSAIEKGQICQLYDNRATSGCTTAGAMIAGVAAMEKVANDTRTQLSIFHEGVFEATASGVVTVGRTLKCCSDANYPNTVGVANALADSGAAIIGYALESAADAARFEFMLRPGLGGNMALS